MRGGGERWEGGRKGNGDVTVGKWRGVQSTYSTYIYNPHTCGRREGRVRGEGRQKGRGKILNYNTLTAGVYLNSGDS